MRNSLVLLSLAAALGCGNGRSVDETQRAAPRGLPPMAGQPAAATDRAAPAADTMALSGSVLERIDAPPYSYLRIATAAGEVWAAVNQTDTAVGATVNVSGTTMQGFKSKSLGRTFDKIVFGTLAGAPAPKAAPAPSAPAAGGAHPHTTSVATDVKVAPAEGPGASTVAGLFANRATLANQEVVVRGKVVKVNNGIMGKTWLHLQDGSGSQEAGDYDIAVTTHDAANLDDIVTVRGPMHLDRDFGAGYTYAVIVEDASVRR